MRHSADRALSLMDEKTAVRLPKGYPRSSILTPRTTEQKMHRGGTAWAIVAVAFVAVGEAYELTQKDREIIDGLKIPDLKRLLRERRVDRGDRHWRRSIRRISHATTERIDL